MYKWCYEDSWRICWSWMTLTCWSGRNVFNYTVLSNSFSKVTPRSTSSWSRSTFNIKLIFPSTSFLFIGVDIPTINFIFHTEISKVSFCPSSKPICWKSPLLPGKFPNRSWQLIKSFVLCWINWTAISWSQWL